MEEYELDPSAVEDAAQLVGEFGQREKQNEATAEAKQVEYDTEQKALTEQADPREADQWGLKAVAKEAQSAVTGGFQDTASSVTTFPERTIDALSGEMAKEKKEKGFYEPDWQPFNSYSDPIVTKTWWGNLMRGAVHFGTMAVGTVAAAKGLAVTGIPLLAGGATALLKAGSLTRAASIGALSDTVSKTSDGHNALGTITKHYGWADTPLTTKDTDHPIVMKIKNIIEGMGIGIAFDGALWMLGKGGSKVKQQIIARNNSVEKQTIEAGLSQLRKGEVEFRADKNAPIADRHQGAHVSEVDAQTAREQLGRTRNEWGSEDGSTGSVTTPVQRERVARESGTTDEIVETTLRKLLSNDKFQAELDAVKGDRQALYDTYRDAIKGFREITDGRSAADMTDLEYLDKLFKANPDVIDGVEIWTARNVVVADLVVGSLLKQLRDTGIAGREIMDLVSIDDIDGPAKQIVDTMLTALFQVKKSRLILSDEFRALGAGKARGRAINDAVTAEMQDAKDSILSILKIAKDDPDDDLLNALFEAFSMMNNVNQLEDFDNFIRTVLYGGKLDATSPDRTGAIIRGLQEMMSHSILSGPKTPFRALMGTSGATFLRPLSTALGATLRYPFEGDAATIRASLASMNGMLEAIPEGFQLFFTRLNSYWKGDMSTIKTRYAEFTKSDVNWELVRKYAESDRASAGDKAAFYWANMVRNLNNVSLFTYSTKVMASIDDTFEFLLGRSKMREKSMRSVLDMQGNGIELPEITPELMRAYQDDFVGQVFDANGNLVDEATKFARREVTLTKELTGKFAKGLNDVFSAVPAARPFFLFARTGVNGLELTAKHTPGFNFLVKEFNDIAFAKPTPEAFAELGPKFGITNARELANAKALQRGRLAMGGALTFMAIQKWMSGEMTGNGPIDRQKRNVWTDAGYKPRTITLGDVQVGYDSFEPFNQIMSMVADIGDASLLMGEEWTKDNLGKVALLLAQGVTSKSYLAGLQSFVDLFGAKPGQGARIGGNLLNNVVPLGGLRNDLGKLFSPYTRELNSGIVDSIRNRNLATENIAFDGGLPIKYDILSGRPVKPYDFMTRAFNMFSPVSFDLTSSPGRTMLFNSGYDMRLSVMYSPEGDNLTDEPRMRSAFQKAIGDQKIEVQLNRLAEDPKVQESIQQMMKDIASGKRSEFEVMDYYHNKAIDRIFQKARKIGWNTIKQDPNIQALKLEERKKKVKRIQKSQDTSGPIPNITNIYK